MAAHGEKKDNQKLKTTNDKSKNGTAPNDLEQQVLRQIEFYFGNINLPRDKFMREKIKVDNGWIPVSTMLTFQRLARLTKDPKVIAKALSHSDLMEVDESGSEIKIRRSPKIPLPELDDKMMKELRERSIYCGKFPVETGIDSLLNFFNQYGPIDNIIMRKYKDKVSKMKKFKGSVFVTFKSKEKGQEFLNLKSVKFEDVELIRKWQSVYIEDKKKEILENKLKRTKKGGGGGAAAAAAAAKDDGFLDTITKETLPLGATINLQGDFTGMKREMIKERFVELGYVPAYIEFKMGEKAAHVRLSEENAGKAFIEKVGSQIEIKESTFKARLLEGEEEKKFLEAATAERVATLKKRQEMKKGGRKARGPKQTAGGGGGGGQKANRADAKKRKGAPIVPEAPQSKMNKA